MKTISHYRIKDALYLRAAFTIMYGPGDDAMLKLAETVYPDSGGIQVLKETNTLNLFYEPVYKEEPKLEVGRWYRAGHYFINIIALPTPGGKCGTVYGICDLGRWVDRAEDFKLIDGSYKLVPATEDEIEEMLIEEAKRRGFENGALVSGKSIGSCWYDNALMTSNRFKYNPWCNQLSLGHHAIFNRGKWATIVPEPKTFSPTMQLRWRCSPNKYGQFTLEQKFTEITTGEEVWEKVPQYEELEF